MGRKDEPKAKSQSNGHNKIQGFVFGINLEGSDEVVTEGIKAFTQAMAKQGMILSPIATSKPTLIAAKTETATVAEHESPEEEQPELDPEMEAVTDDDDGAGSRPKKPRRVPRPNFLKDVNLTQAKVPLADFMKQKNPQVMLDKYAVVAVWLKEMGTAGATK